MTTQNYFDNQPFTNRRDVLQAPGTTCTVRDEIFAFRDERAQKMPAPRPAFSMKGEKYRRRIARYCTSTLAWYIFLEAWPEIRSQ